jgi:hypothetical protein
MLHFDMKQGGELKTPQRRGVFAAHGTNEQRSGGL